MSEHFKPMTFDDLMRLPKETREQSYRRGYRDGYIAALYAAYGNRGVPEHLWNFWQDNLRKWKSEDTEKLVFPPVYTKR